jgi:tripartite-type tricarboxylate transporter receptor subunit TctC
MEHPARTAHRASGTPPPVLDRLSRELVQIVKSPGFAGRVEPLGFEARTTTRDEFAQFNADEIKRWGDIVRALGIQLNQ